MRRVLGVNTWVWTSPLTDASLDRIARSAAAMGFGAIEVPVESPGDWDPARAADACALPSSQAHSALGSRDCCRNLHSSTALLNHR